MAAPKSVVWNLEPHTRAKHEILRRYLQAWMPILSHGGFPEVWYIDGFAGPGEYNNDEEGSPIIALKAALASNPKLRAKFKFLFVEKDPARAEHLESRISHLPLQANFDVTVEGGSTFENAFNQHFGARVASGARIPPTFAFIDPFGWKGAPFSIVERIMQHGSCEVFINFIYEEMNRFLGHPDQAENFTAYFGTDDWKSLASVTDPIVRNKGLHELYANQLRKKAGAKFVRSFEMKNDKDVTDYFLFYATNNLLGMKKMKEAMWKVDEAGEFSFSDATNPNQFMLFTKEPNIAALRQAIVGKFANQDVTVGTIETFVVVETAFRETHFKRQVLAALQQEGKLEIRPGPPQTRRGTFSDQKLVVRILN
jgi:three-Cys-motif partner protein